ncbi:NADP-binding protein [Pseudoalteromonas byunsanensis]|uniref:NADP-binding protein n=1 Tax=Pseudoalteromonas byunsanensis TaxID=327939 RepID=A0A1S1N9Q5_9GAMM|nr:NADP-binding protein [Pseudoalteromonas byunsanensis]OHU96095.1 NADP-binding protein [Pseudoalteromonas byunsanensis]
MNKLVVLGAGWLGKPLCLQAIARGWQVEGTRTQPVQESGFERKLHLNAGVIQHSITLRDAWWVCAIPPRARSEESTYLETLEKSLLLSKQLDCKGFLLCSSTGVYSDDSGCYSEQNETSIASSRQRILVNAEQQVLNQSGKVLRLAGLVGEGREPGRFVSGKQLRSSSQGSVNMVHQQDVINAIFTVLNSWSEAKNIYNICHPSHPSRQAYYQQKCHQLGTATPTFASDEKVERVINGAAICQLGFHYQHEI